MTEAFFSVRPVPASLAIAGAVVLALSIHWADRDVIPDAERRVFRAINGLPDALYVPLWLPMQFGNLVVGLVVGLAVAALLHDGVIAIAVVVATVSKLVVERVVRARTKSFADVRQRPGVSEPGATLRGDVPASGASFPSGHVILAAGVAAVLSTALSPTLVWIPWLFVALVAFGRVYVGAHNPLDVAAGLGVGMVIGGVLEILLR